MWAWACVKDILISYVKVLYGVSFNIVYKTTLHPHQAVLRAFLLTNGICKMLLVLKCRYVCSKAENATVPNSLSCQTQVLDLRKRPDEAGFVAWAYNGTCVNENGVSRCVTDDSSPPKPSIVPSSALGAAFPNGNLSYPANGIARAFPGGETVWQLPPAIATGGQTLALKGTNQWALELKLEQPDSADSAKGRGRGWRRTSSTTAAVTVPTNALLSYIREGAPLPPPSLIGRSRNTTCRIRAGANCHKADLNLSKQFEAATVADCCAACEAEPLCKAWTVDSRKAVPGKYVGACYLKSSCDGLAPDRLSVSGMADDARFPFALCQYPDKAWVNCSAATFPMMCAALDQPGCCHWCGSPATGSCYPNRTECPAEERSGTEVDAEAHTQYVILGAADGELKWSQAVVRGRPGRGIDSAHGVHFSTTDARRFYVVFDSEEGGLVLAAHTLP